jgi:hypothetical protein
MKRLVGANLRRSSNGKISVTECSEHTQHPCELRQDFYVDQNVRTSFTGRAKVPPYRDMFVHGQIPPLDAYLPAEWAIDFQEYDCNGAGSGLTASTYR